MIENCQRSINRAIFFHSEIFWLDRYGGKPSNFDCDLYVLKVFEEFFRQVRFESPFDFLQKENQNTKYMTRFNQKGLLRTSHSRTVTKRKSLENTLGKGFIWITSFDHLPKFWKVWPEIKYCYIWKKKKNCISLMNEIWKTFSLEGQFFWVSNWNHKWNLRNDQSSFTNSYFSHQSEILGLLFLYLGVSGSLGQKPEELTSSFSVLAKWMTNTFTL